MTVINSNISAMKAQQSLTTNQRNLDMAMTRLSTGLRINSAKDDAAGLAIATRMDTQIRGVSQAIRNANDGMSLAQTAEGALGEVTNILQRMRELAVQSANSINSDTDRGSLDLEVQQLKTELDRIATTTSFNNQKLLDGTFKSKNLQIGASAGQSISINIGSVKNTALGMGQASFGGDVIVSGRSSLGTAIEAGDIVINGQSLMAIDADDDLGRVVEKINLSIDNVEASAFNIASADAKGNGVAAADDIVITVTQLGAETETVFTLGASTSMEELVDNITTLSEWIKIYSPQKYFNSIVDTENELYLQDFSYILQEQSQQSDKMLEISDCQNKFIEQSLRLFMKDKIVSKAQIYGVYWKIETPLSMVWKIIQDILK